MARLSNETRKIVWAEFMSQISSRRGFFGGLSKEDLRAAVDAIDEWIEDNMASFNSAIGQPARDALTTKQKVELFFAIVKKRWEVS